MNLIKKFVRWLKGISKDLLGTNILHISNGIYLSFGNAKFARRFIPSSKKLQCVLVGEKNEINGEVFPSFEKIRRFSELIFTCSHRPILIQFSEKKEKIEFLIFAVSFTVFLIFRQNFEINLTRGDIFRIYKLALGCVAGKTNHDFSNLVFRFVSSYIFFLKSSYSSSERNSVVLITSLKMEQNFQLEIGEKIFSSVSNLIKFEGDGFELKNETEIIFKFLDEKKFNFLKIQISSAILKFWSKEFTEKIILTNSDFSSFEIFSPLNFNLEIEANQFISSSHSAISLRGLPSLLSLPEEETPKTQQAAQERISRRLLNIKDESKLLAYSQLLSSLPTFKYNDITNDDPMAHQCQICLIDFEEGELVRALPCLHSFHSDCIDEWLVVSFTCPQCRVDLFDKNSNLE